MLVRDANQTRPATLTCNTVKRVLALASALPIVLPALLFMRLMAAVG